MVRKHVSGMGAGIGRGEEIQQRGEKNNETSAITTSKHYFQRSKHIQFRLIICANL